LREKTGIIDGLTLFDSDGQKFGAATLTRLDVSHGSDERNVGTPRAHRFHYCRIRLTNLNAERQPGHAGNSFEYRLVISLSAILCAAIGRNENYAQRISGLAGWCWHR